MLLHQNLTAGTVFPLDVMSLQCLFIVEFNFLIMLMASRAPPPLLFYFHSELLIPFRACMR